MEANVRSWPPPPPPSDHTIGGEGGGWKRQTPDHGLPLNHDVYRSAFQAIRPQDLIRIAKIALRVFYVTIPNVPHGGEQHASGSSSEGSCQ